jgi:hypothetical protein
MLNIRELSVCAKNCARCFIIIPLNPLNHSERVTLIISRKLRLERLTNLQEVAQLLSGGAEIWTWALSKAMCYGSVLENILNIPVKD